MKFIASILIAIAAVSALPSSKYLPSWQSYKETHNKLYDTQEEERIRFQIFKENVEKIEKHNQLYDAGFETYRMGINQFTDMTTEEFIEYLELCGPQPKVDAPVYEAPVDVELPESIDYRDKHAVNPVKDQAQCGSCWAFSTTGSLESQNFLKRGKLLSLSEQNLVDCSSGYGNLGCSGGLMSSAFNYIKDNGLETEAAYPYTAEDGTCRFNKSKSVITVKGFTNIAKGSEAALQAAVATKGPVSVAVDGSSWQMYSSGILCVREPYMLNHGVVAIGYGVEKNDKYWLIRNSWGELWGEEGYIRICRDVNNQVGVSDNACYPNL